MRRPTSTAAPSHPVHELEWAHCPSRTARNRSVCAPVSTGRYHRARPATGRCSRISGDGSPIRQGLAHRPPLTGQWSERWGREATTKLLRTGESFDGLFCGSDQIARGALDTLREAGRRVPDQVGVIGVDNWVVMAEGARPSLSTIDLNLAELGHRAADALLAALKGHPLPPGTQSLPCRLVARASTESSS